MDGRRLYMYFSAQNIAMGSWIVDHNSWNNSCTLAKSTMESLP
jgi:hypothetical protein